jgi:hypothetical protein
LIAVDYVDAAGEPRHTSETDDPEALWAFRGGGGVGIVTRLELRLWAHATVYAGTRFWSIEHLPAVVERWIKSSESFPAEITSHVWALNAPDAPVLPESLRGRAVIAIGACGTDIASAQAHMTDCFEPLPEPLCSSFAERRPEQLSEIHLDPQVRCRQSARAAYSPSSNPRALSPSWRRQVLVTVRLLWSSFASSAAH